MFLLYASAAISLAVGGVVIGVIGVVCLRIHREERDRSITEDATTSTGRGVRRLTGLSVRGYKYVRESARSS
jgi:hypothetical protein